MYYAPPQTENVNFVEKGPYYEVELIVCDFWQSTYLISRNMQNHEVHQKEFKFSFTFNKKRGYEY